MFRSDVAGKTDRDRLRTVVFSTQHVICGTGGGDEVLNIDSQSNAIRN